MYLPSTSCGEIGLILHQILYKLLGYKTNGVFIEIGANDGFTGSFTYNLAKIGWRGIYCEPVPRIFAQCQNNHAMHPNVTVLNIAADEKKHTVQIVDGGTLSTMDKETYDIYLKTHWARSNFKNSTVHMVETEQLDTILANNQIQSNIDLFVLDVEGYEENVLRGFSITNYNPKIVVIEIADQHESFVNNDKLMAKFANLREYFKTNGYSLLVNDVVDNVYIRNDLFNIKDRILFSMTIKFPQLAAQLTL